MAGFFMGAGWGWRLVTAISMFSLLGGRHGDA